MSSLPKTPFTCGRQVQFVQTEKKNLRIRKYLSTCGRGLQRINFFLSLPHNKHLFFKTLSICNTTIHYTTYTTGTTYSTNIDYSAYIT